MLKQVVFALAAVVMVPAFAIIKCVGADGKTVFQDVPCAGQGQKIDVKPASGNATATSPLPPNATLPSGAAGDKKEGAFGERWQRRTYLENRGVPDARSAISSHQAQCDSQQRSLAAKKGSATNNLAGATWEQSISAEMQAAATACDTRARELRKQLESLEKELRDLKAAGV